MCAKGFGIALVNAFNGINEFTNGITYLIIVNLLVCLSVQMIYLNKALDVYNTSVVGILFVVV